MDTKEDKPLTRSAFHVLLRKAAQPIPKEAELPSQEASETSGSHPSDGCTAKHKSPDKTEGSGESPNG